MKGVVFTIIFFLLGVLLSGTPPAEPRYALSDVQVESTSHISFDSIKVYPDEVRIMQPGLQYAKVKSDSMAPLLTHDSIVFEKIPSSPDEIKTGDVISFYEPTTDAIILHMVINIIQKDGKTYYITKGIANDKADDWLVPYENVKVIMVGTVR